MTTPVAKKPYGSRLEEKTASGVRKELDRFKSLARKSDAVLLEKLADRRIEGPANTKTPVIDRLNPSKIKLIVDALAKGQRVEIPFSCITQEAVSNLNLLFVVVPVPEKNLYLVRSLK